jgi:hypothetical protein
MLDLIKHGLLVPEEKYKYSKNIKWRFSGQELHKAISEIIGNYPPYTKNSGNNQGYSTLGQALRIVSASDISFIDLILAIRNGDLAFRLAKGKLNIQAIIVSKDHLKAFQEAWQYPDGNISYSIYTTSKKISCGIDTMVHLKEASLLLPLNSELDDPKKWRYLKSSILKFTERFITTDQVSTIIGITPNMVSRWANDSLLLAVSGPGIDNAHFYRFEKEYILNWRSERLLPEEAISILGIRPRTFEDWKSKGIVKPMKEARKGHNWFSRSEIMTLANEREKEKLSDKEIEKFLKDLRRILEKLNENLVEFFLPDDLWNLIETKIDKVFPHKKMDDQRVADDRQVINAIIWVGINNKSFSQLPDSYPSRRTCRRRLLHWQKTGFLDILYSVICTYLRNY